MRFRRSYLAAPILALVPGAVFAADISPVGAEFRVNSYTTGSQYEAAVASEANGDFVVAWVSEGSPGDDSASTSIVAARFRSDGSSAGDAFQVNTYSTGGQFRPDVAVDATGAFVIAWDGPGVGSDLDNGAIHVRRFGSDGVAAGPQMQVNSYTTNAQRRPNVALADSGRFVVAWDSYGSSGTDCCLYPASTSIQAQRFASDGLAIGTEIQVNTYTTGFQENAAVAIEADADFVVVWGSSKADGDSSSYSVQGRRFASDGTPRGDPFQVNAYTTGSQDLPEIAMDASGRFAVVWSGVGFGGADREIQLRRFDAAGDPIAEEVQVNDYATGSQYEPTIAMSPTGDFVVGWYGYGSADTDDDASSVHARLHTPAGNPIGSEFQANSYTTSYQYVTRVAMDGDGNFVVAWHSDGPAAEDDDGYGIRAQRYAEPPIFRDGFEEGDTAAWSLVIPPPDR